jgi:hypothetical protein
LVHLGSERISKTQITAAGIPRYETGQRGNLSNFMGVSLQR